MTRPATEKRRIWALPIRLFHWALAGCVIAAWIIGENLSFTNISTHFLLGYMVGGLVAFRILWGLFAKGPTSLKALFPAPKQVKAYMGGMTRRAPSYWPGHNPVGALAVLALLTSLILQVVTGLFIESDDFFDGGPLADMVGDKLQGTLTFLHHLNSKILLALIIAHVGAALFYLIWKRENLIGAMITGRKEVKTDSE